MQFRKLVKISAFDPRSVPYIVQLLKIVVKQQALPSLDSLPDAKSAPVAQCCRLKLLYGFSNRQIDAAATELASMRAGPSFRLKAALDAFPMIFEVDDIDGRHVASVIHWISIIMSIPDLEVAVSICPTERRTVVHEYCETEEFRQLTQHYNDLHSQKHRSGEPGCIVALMEYADKHQVFKGSKEA